MFRNTVSKPRTVSKCRLTLNFTVMPREVFFSRRGCNYHADINTDMMLELMTMRTPSPDPLSNFDVTRILRGVAEQCQGKQPGVYNATVTCLLEKNDKGLSTAAIVVESDIIQTQKGLTWPDIHFPRTLFTPSEDHNLELLGDHSIIDNFLDEKKLAGKKASKL